MMRYRVCILYRIILHTLRVGDIQFVSCSTSVYEALLMDCVRNLEVGIPDLLEEGIKLVIRLWKGKERFNACPEVPFEVYGREIGLFKSYGPLNLLKVRGASHMVPMDQLRAALEILKEANQGLNIVPMDQLTAALEMLKRRTKG
ncbi:putative carboxypeptidase C [Helianthus anomalus]